MLVDRSPASSVSPALERSLGRSACSPPRETALDPDGDPIKDERGCPQRHEVLGGSDAGLLDLELQPRHLHHRHRRLLPRPLLRQQQRAGVPPGAHTRTRPATRPLHSTIAWEDPNRGRPARSSAPCTRRSPATPRASRGARSHAPCLVGCSQSVRQSLPHSYQRSTRCTYARSVLDECVAGSQVG